MRIRTFIFLLMAPLLVSASKSSVGESQMAFRYTDDKGAVHIVSSLDLAPMKYWDRLVAIKFVTIKKEKEKPAQYEGASLTGKNLTVSLKVDNKRLVAPARFDAVVVRHVSLDTGSELCVITTKLAGALGYDLKTAEKGRFMTPAGTVTAPVVTLQAVTIGPASARRVRAVVIDFPWRGATAAIIGMNFLSQFTFAIDPAEKTITFHKSRAMRSDGG